MIWLRRAPISFITPICGTCCVMSADIALTTRKLDRSQDDQSKRGEDEHDAADEGIRSALGDHLAAVHRAARILELRLDLIERGEDMRLVMRRLGGTNEHLGVRRRVAQALQGFGGDVERRGAGQCGAEPLPVVNGPYDAQRARRRRCSARS